MSIAKENFLKVIYNLNQSPEKKAKPGVVAEILGISNAAATDMARNLSAKGLVHYQKYKQLFLTKEGEAMALSLIRKHRLWETFLHEVLGLSFHEIHREAEMLEHQTSDFLAEKVSAYLGNPTIDPHGDPIPSAEGVVTSDSAVIPLSQAEEGLYTIVRMTGSEEDFFEFCKANGLLLQSDLVLEKKYPAQKSIAIKINNQKMLLNDIIGNEIYVKPKNQLK